MPLSFGFSANVAASSSAASFALRSAGKDAEKNGCVVLLGFGMKGSHCNRRERNAVSQPPAPESGSLSVMGESLRRVTTLRELNLGQDAISTRGALISIIIHR
jgi:hypothetical protein